MNWEALKKAEKGERVSALDGVPRSLPALTMAAEMQKRMRKTGFEWPNREGAEAKLAEELAELRDAPTPEAAAAELGDVLFVLTELANWYGANAEDALRGTNVKVEARFRYVEDRVRERGLTVSDVPLAELVAIWQQCEDARPLAGVSEPTRVLGGRKRHADSAPAPGRGRRSAAPRPSTRTAWTPCTTLCSPGTGGLAATCPGGARAIRTRSWSRRSCSSRPRWTG